MREIETSLLKAAIKLYSRLSDSEEIHSSAIKSAKRLVDLAQKNQLWPVDYAWAPAYEEEAAKLLDDIAVSLIYTKPPLTEELLSMPRALFLVSELRDIQPVSDGGAIELWRTRAIDFPPPFPAPTLSVLRDKVTFEAHGKGEIGWHFHPLNKRGNRLPYRMLFSCERTQNDLWWEEHSSGSKTKTKKSFGDPKKDVLPKTTSEGLYKACLDSVRNEGAFGKGEKYSDWSKQFVKAGKKTYLAHCEADRLKNSHPSKATRFTDHPSCPI